MEPLSEKLVEKTLQEVATFTPDRAKKEMMRLGKNQPELLSFIVQFTEELALEVKELALYMFYVICRMFEKGYEKKIKKISPEEIIDCYERNEKLVESLEGVHDKFYERIARVQISGQPYVIKYVVETLFEAPEDEEPVDLTDEDVGYLFLLLKTVVELLDRKTDV
jgi:hypothetical protein